MSIDALDFCFVIPWYRDIDLEFDLDRILDVRVPSAWLSLLPRLSFAESFRRSPFRPFILAPCCTCWTLGSSWAQSSVKRGTRTAENTVRYDRHEVRDWTELRYASCSFVEYARKKEGEWGSRTDWTKTNNSTECEKDGRAYREKREIKEGKSKTYEQIREKKRQ